MSLCPWCGRAPLELKDEDCTPDLTEEHWVGDVEYVASEAEELAERMFFCVSDSDKFTYYVCPQCERFQVWCCGEACVLSSLGDECVCEHTPECSGVCNSDGPETFSDLTYLHINRCGGEETFYDDVTPVTVPVRGGDGPGKISLTGHDGGKGFSMRCLACLEEYHFNDK